MRVLFRVLGVPGQAASLTISIDLSIAYRADTTRWRGGTAEAESSVGRSAT
jgi:hypothetical protein